MRIAHVLRRLSFDDWGGSEQVAWNIAKAQLAAGHEVAIFATDALCPVAHEVREGLEISRFHPLYPWWPMPARLIAELDRKGGNPFVPGLGAALRAWRPEAIHCHAMGRIAELCLRVSRRLGVKTAVSLHGGGANVPLAEAKSLRSPISGLLPWGKAVDYLMGWARQIPMDADGIVCVGEDEYAAYRDRHPHVIYLPNGVDCKAFAAARGRSREGRDGLRMVCVARIDRQKNQMMLVEALARHPEMRLRLVGPVTQPDYRDEIAARADELGVAGRLEIVGALKPGSAELAEEYANADVFALPSRHEPFGIVVLEAWASGVPVVASAVGGLQRLCAANDGAAQLFAPGDAADFDAALARALRTREAMVAEGFAAAKKYDWRILSARLVEFYRGL